MGSSLSDVNKRWLPPSPHREAVQAWVEKGRAHIEKRGHDTPPLLHFEDGGQMELHRARIRPGGRKDSHGLTRLMSGESEDEQGTPFTDVCGTVDRFEELLDSMEDNRSPDEATAEKLDELIRHALYMIQRMQKRGNEYRRFAAEVRKAADAMGELRLPDIRPAGRAGRELSAFLKNHAPGEISGEKDHLCKLANRMRSVAGETEKVLYAYRDAAVELGDLYRKIRGARNWTAGGE